MTKTTTGRVSVHFKLDLLNKCGFLLFYKVNVFIMNV